MTAQGASRIEPLDGLRGLAALWVFAGHALVLSQAWVPILGRPLLAVDLFMMLSGALMVYQADLREGREPMAEPTTWLRFWTRRFFRIAPVFYLLFLAALAMAPWLGEMREIIVAHGARPVDGERYGDQSLTNILLHLSFVFSVLPDYTDRSALPDWSIGLEMQFYLVFPFILLLLRRIGFVAGAVLLTLLAWAPWLVAAGWLESFPRPSLLILKLNMFLAGMLIMRARDEAGLRRWLSIGVALVIAVLPLDPILHWSETVVRALTVLLVSASIIPGVLRAPWLEAPAELGRKLLGSPPAKWIGDVSYGVYLVHLVVLVPVVALVKELLPLPVHLQAALAFAASVAIVYPLSALLHRWIEQPGIDLGRRVVSRISPRTPSRSPADA